MVTNNRIADLIRENRPEAIPEAIAEGQFFQMQTFTQALIDHVLSGQVDKEVAANASTDKHDFLVALEYAMKRQAVDEAAEHAAAEQARAEEEGAMPELRIVRPAEG